MSNYSNNRMVDDPNHVWNKLANLIPDNSDVLDIGCSSGNFSEALIDRKNCRVDGVEPDEKDAKIAAKKLGHIWTFDIEDPKNVSQIGKKYDVLVFADVLEHLVQPSKTLKLVRSLVKPGGRVVFSVPNMAHVSVRLDLLAGNFRYTETGLLDKTHLHFYDLDTVTTMIKDADMSLAHIDGVTYGYPDALIHKNLNKLGYTSNEAGMARLRDPRAAIFQYVGAATYEKTKGKKDAQLSPQMTVLSLDIQNLVDDLNHVRTELEVEKSKSKKLNEELQTLRNSKSYKVGTAVVAPAHKVRSSLEKLRKQS